MLISAFVREQGVLETTLARLKDAKCGPLG
jgi:hypothetical protein